MQRTYRPDQPFPLWLVFPLLFSGVYLSHLSLLRLPYYWDEAGYYIPAAYDFFRTGSLIPQSTLSNAHPPLPALYLALWWWASGFAALVTRVAMCVVAAVALLGVYRLAQVATGRTAIAVAAVLLTLLYPVWFAQSTLAHADLFAAAGTLWGLAFFLDKPEDDRPEDRGQRGRRWAAAACFALACLSKETAVITPLTLAAYELWTAVRRPGARAAAEGEASPLAAAPQPLQSAALLLASLLPLCGWYAFHWHRTGFVFGNPQYLRYNATATLQPLRILLALVHRIVQVTAHMNMFVPVLCGVASLLLPPRTQRAGAVPRVLSRDALSVLVSIIATNILFFSVLGGALLTRYLLPAFPLVLIGCVSVFYRRVPLWWALVGLSAAAFALGIFINPPYRFAPEDNLSYRDAILLDQEAIRLIVTKYPASTVLTAWPVSDELRKPELGYVKHPVPVVPIDNFSLAEIERARAEPGAYEAALAFSTKYDPPRPAWSLGHKNEALDQRFFDFHHDLRPAQIAALLGGAVVWQDERKGEWAAVLHFSRPELARAGSPAPHP